MKADGSQAIKLTDDQNYEHNWVRPSPDGEKILFYKQNKGTGVNDGSTNRLWIMNSDGSNSHQVLTMDKYNWNVMAHGEWSPDSSHIVMAVGLPSVEAQLVTIDTNGNNLEQVTHLRSIDGSSSLANSIDPSWPQPNKIVFIRTWNCLFLCANQDVFTIDLQTKQETRLTNDARLDWDPYLSPDGSKYLWLKYDCIGCTADLYTSPASGTFTPQPLISDGQSNATGTFSPDSKYVIFPKIESYGFTAWYSIYRINVDGTGLTRISKDTQHSLEGIPSYWP